MKQVITPETAMKEFINSKKEGREASQTVLDSIKNYRKWTENQLKGLLNASSYFPEILSEDNMEENINSLLKKFQDRIVLHKK